MTKTLLDGISASERGGDKNMGRFALEFEVANNDDIVRLRLKQIKPAQVRRTMVRGYVDTGAALMVLPASVVEKLGLPTKGKVKVRYADGRRATRTEVEAAHVTILGRSNVFSALVEPKRDTALIGAVVMEVLDLLVDCNNQRLRPRDPDFIISEIE
jgi:predicted aspartyl protease